MNIRSAKDMCCDIQFLLVPFKRLIERPAQTKGIQGTCTGEHTLDEPLSPPGGAVRKSPSSRCNYDYV